MRILKEARMYVNDAIISKTKRNHKKHSNVIFTPFYYKNKRRKAGSLKERAILLRTKRIQTCWLMAVI